MAYTNPKYKGNINKIVNILTSDCIYKILFGEKINESIGTNLRILKFKKNLTQEEAAKALGISTCMVGRYERSENQPRKDTIQKLANFYGVNVEEIEKVKN